MDALLEHRQDVVDVGVVSGMLFEMDETKLVAGTDHQCASELKWSRSGLLLTVPGGEGSRGCAPLVRVERGAGRHRLCPDHRSRRTVHIEEHPERHLLAFDEGLRHATATGSDGGDICSPLGDLLIPVTHLRHALTAGQSTEVAQEEQHCRV